MSTNIVRILEANAEQFPEKTAIIHGKRSITYGQLLQNVRRRAALLAKNDIGPGDGVLIVVPMSIPLYEILIALFHLGAVAVFVDAWGNRQRLELARDMFPMKGFVGVGMAHLVRLLSASLRSIPIKLRATLPKSWREEIHNPSDVSPNETALITFTTGSTGKPKGANRTHAFLLSQHHALQNHLTPSISDVDMPTLPIFPLSNLAVGSTTVLPDINFSSMATFNPRTVVRDIQNNNVTTASGSPAFFLRLAKYLKENQIALPTVQRIFVGGAPVFPRNAEALQEALPNAEISIVYGSTEAEPVSGIKAIELIEASASQEIIGLPVGRPVQDISLRILPIQNDVASQQGTSTDCKDHGSHAKGEICVAGNHVLKEYTGDPADWKEKFIELDGERWLRTGDAGYLDENGLLYLLGRTKNSWEENGERVFTLPIELVLGNIKEVQVGTILRTNNETVVVVEAVGTAKNISEKVNKKLTELNIPFNKIVQLREIPRDPRHASKIDYQRLVEELADGS